MDHLQRSHRKHQQSESIDCLKSVFRDDPFITLYLIVRFRKRQISFMKMNEAIQAILNGIRNALLSYPEIH